MKTQDFKELRKKDIDELEQLATELRAEVMGLRFSHATGALENSSRLGLAKRDVARVMTLIGDKRREAKKSEVTAS